ncbi:hypothetical protein M0802_014394 [Mischocyttarus mexicanus]|nr:hypothetical protein M0802_014394 [Mischocyttarus mexicanus]
MAGALEHIETNWTNKEARKIFQRPLTTSVKFFAKVWDARPQISQQPAAKQQSSQQLAAKQEPQCEAMQEHMKMQYVRKAAPHAHSPEKSERQCTKTKDISGSVKLVQLHFKYDDVISEAAIIIYRPSHLHLSHLRRLKESDSHRPSQISIDHLIHLLHSALKLPFFVQLAKPVPSLLRKFRLYYVFSLILDQSNLKALILPEITSKGPLSIISEQDWPYLRPPRLADPDFLTSNPIDLLIVTDNLRRIMVISSYQERRLRAHNILFEVRLGSSRRDLQPKSSQLSYNLPCHLKQSSQQNCHKVLGSGRSLIFSHVVSKSRRV